MATLTLGLQHLRSSFNEAFPGRDKASDGWIGDAAHAAEGSSGHNPESSGHAEYNDHDSVDEVRAIDVDSDLRSPGTTMEDVVQWLVNRGRNGNLEIVVRYLIYNRRIWSASDNWVTHTYTGPSPHTEHLHVSGAWTQASDNNTTYNYELDEVNMPSLQDILSGIGADLQNDNSGISRGMRKQILNTINAEIVPFVGPAGTRVHAAGWSDKTLSDIMTRMFSAFFGAEITAGDGSATNLVQLLPQAAQSALEASDDANEVKGQVGELNTLANDTKQDVETLLSRVPAP